MRQTSIWQITAALILLLTGFGPPAASEEQSLRTAINGHWIINEELSDDTDRKVEEAILSAGGRLPNTGKKGKERYRGGPREHALYDHVSYDRTLHFHYDEPEFRLIYDDGFERVFHSDNRKREVSASGTSSGDDSDFSFASWDGGRLIVESTVREGGWIFEVYRLKPGGEQLRVNLELKPSSFANPIRITRIYDRRKEPGISGVSVD